MPVEKSAGAIIFRRDKGIVKYLLLHYESRHWDFPKGHIEKGEKELETVKREIEEETSLKELEFVEGFKEWIKYFFKLTPKKNQRFLTGQEGKTVFKIVTFYLAETKTKKIKISFEHIDYKWLPYAEALEQLTFKNAKKILEKANNFLTMFNTRG